MTTKQILDLTDQEVHDLLLALCRSRKAIIPQFFTREHIAFITGIEPTDETMSKIQGGFDRDWSLLDHIEENICLLSKAQETFENDWYDF